MDWRVQGLCHGENPNRWFPERVNDTQIPKAKAICHACPVQADCLEFGLQSRLLDGTLVQGIFGGATYEERLRILIWMGDRTYAEMQQAVSG